VAAVGEREWEIYVLMYCSERVSWTVKTGLWWWQASVARMSGRASSETRRDETRRGARYEMRDARGGARKQARSLSSSIDGGEVGREFWSNETMRCWIDDENSWHQRAWTGRVVVYCGHHTTELCFTRVSPITYLGTVVSPPVDSRGVQSSMRSNSLYCRFTSHAIYIPIYMHAGSSTYM
jgi:hypothetical protein